MKKVFTLFFALGALSFSLQAQGTRYIDEVFTDVTTLTNQIYSVNISVLTGAPAADTLLFDLYAPLGDTCTNRPLAVVLHTGTFLPRGLFAPTGDKDDYANVQVCTRLAKRGYVAASVQYRLGWNPVAQSDTVRRSTIINAAYRSVQDLYAFIRFMNMTIEDFNNPFKIDSSRVALFGIGTGGFVGFNAAVLEQSEIYIDKFTNPSGAPMIDTNLVGDLHGIKAGLINIPNHVGYNDDFHFAFGLDGAVGDSSWMDDGKSVPLVVAGIVTHPTTPYGIDPISGEINCDLPVYAGAGTGTFVVNIGGSICMIEKANTLGINNPLLKGNWDDPVSEEIRTNPNVFGQEHVWGINLPGPQTGAWEYWDAVFWDMIQHPIAPPGVSIHDVALTTNPDMSLDKANRYIDTALWFFSPRAFVVLKLNELNCSCEGVVPDPTINLVNDFECQRNWAFGSGIDRVMIMDNPDPDGANSSTKVGAYNDPTNDPWAALCPVNGSSINLSEFHQFKVDVNSPAAGVPFLLKLEGGTSPAAEVWDTTTTSGSWETLFADFSGQATADHTRVCIFPNASIDSPDEAVYLLDNIRFEPIIIGTFTPVVESLDISPNPVSNTLYIRNPGEAVHFRLVNILGQEMLNATAFGQEIISLDVNDLQTGIYMVAAYDAKGNLLANARLLKN